MDCRPPSSVSLSSLNLINPFLATYVRLMANYAIATWSTIHKDSLVQCAKCHDPYLTTFTVLSGITARYSDRAATNYLITNPRSQTRPPPPPPAFFLRDEPPFFLLHHHTQSRLGHVQIDVTRHIKQHNGRTPGNPGRRGRDLRFLG